MLETILRNFNVATTALLANFWKNTAKKQNEWVHLTQKQGTREKDLFKDSLMPHFINEQIRIDASERLDKRMWLPLATRTRFFRRTVSHAVKHQAVKQIIILGSGFDTLPARKEKYSRDFGVRFFEVDQPQILNCKREIYTEQQINKNATYVGLDYVKVDWLAELIKHGVDLLKPTLILWEGNTFYLEKEEVLAILAQLSLQFANLIITFDYMHALMHTQTQHLDSAAKERCLENTLQQFASKKSPFKAFFNPQELVTHCEILGIKCINHKTAAQLAKEYEVDETPYYTAETYSVVTFQK